MANEDDKTSRAQTRASALTKRADAWQQVQAEDAASAKAEAAKTARLRALRLAKEASEAPKDVAPAKKRNKSK